MQPTGLCSRSAGYATNSVSQALWELLHAETCATEPPFTCTPLVALRAATSPPEEVIGEALLYALRLSGGTYRAFLGDLVTYLACNHGEAVYAEVNGVLCHHSLRPCDAPAPVLCEVCGNNLREGGEDCDGGDLGGHTCTSLGYAGGTLACGPGCTLDPAGCTPAEIESASDTTSETTMPGDTPTDPGADSATTGGMADEAGCACNSPADAPPLVPLIGFLVLLGLRGRRQSQGRLLTILGLGLLLGLAACSREPMVPVGEVPETETETDTDTDTETFPAEPDPRYFRTYHVDTIHVGWSNEHYPKDSIVISAISLATLFADGRFRLHNYGCLEEPLNDRTYDWVYDPGTGAFVIAPEGGDTLPGGHYEFTSIVLKPDPECDGNLQMAIIDDRGEAWVHGLRPGWVCADISDLERCWYSIVWCDEGEPGPICPEP